MAETEEKKVKPPSPKKRKRTVWLIVQWIGIPIFCLLGLLVGLAIGYVYLGKRPMEEVYEFETWRHIYDLIFAETE